MVDEMKSVLLFKGMPERTKGKSSTDLEVKGDMNARGKNAHTHTHTLSNGKKKSTKAAERISTTRNSNDHLFNEILPSFENRENEHFFFLHRFKKMKPD